MSSLTEEERREIGQHFVFGFHGHQVSDEIKTLIRDYYLGNVILFKRNVESITHVHRLTTELQALAREAGHTHPLLIGIDQENGLVSAFSMPGAGTQFPGAMALAASGSPELATEVTTATGKELKAAGINWVYSPVADVNSDPRNPVIGVRSYSDDPTTAARYVQAVSAAFTAQNIAPSAKHFPGHGNTHVDSHLSLPRILVNKASLKATELVPFEALVKDGIASIMTGHMALPLVTGDDTPCSLSREITTHLLRGEMGYKGVVVTDCLEMEAVAETYGSEGGAVRALQAGADIVMICHQYQRHVGALEATYAAVKEGTLTIDELKASGARIAALKDEFAGSWDNVFTSFPSNMLALQPEHELLSKRAYAASISHFPNSRSFAPLSTNGPAVLFTPRMESLNRAVDDAEDQLRDAAGNLRNTVGPSYSAFAKSIAQRVPAIEHIVYAPNQEIDSDVLEKLLTADSIVFATRNGYEKGAWQVEFFKKVAAAAQDQSPKLVAVSSCAPYDLLTLGALPVPAIATFEFTVPALEAAAAAIYGEAPVSGTIPVKMTAV